jgi:hypothetical protein
MCIYILYGISHPKQIPGSMGQCRVKMVNVPVNRQSPFSNIHRTYPPATRPQKHHSISFHRPNISLPILDIRTLHSKKTSRYRMIYPLVNVYITMENHHAINGYINQLFLWPFSIAMFVYQRVEQAIRFDQTSTIYNYRTCMKCCPIVSYGFPMFVPAIKHYKPP